MTAVLVHGVPETTEVWNLLTPHLPGEVVTLALPGFGTPLPAGFETTMDGYATWLADELGKFDQRVHLVAHDWGALLSLRVLAGQPENIASWVLDSGNLSDDFEWHDLAKLWQTPGEGEGFMQVMLAASVTDRAAMLAGSGVPTDGTTAMAEGLDATMASAILSLYRSATSIGPDWGPGIDQIAGRGLLIEAAKDPYRSPGSSAALADRTGALIAQLPTAGHWWMLDDPGGAAALITDFWGLNAAS